MTALIGHRSPVLRCPGQKALLTSRVALHLLQVPPNGLVVYTGTVLTEDGKERKVNIDFEPFKPINTSLYLCDNKFHTEALNELLEADNKYVCLADSGACPSPAGSALHFHGAADLRDRAYGNALAISA